MVNAMDKFKLKYLSNVKSLVSQLDNIYNDMEDKFIMEKINELKTEGRTLDTIQKRQKLNTVKALDDKGPGNANHKYGIYDKSTETEICEIQFQKGPRNEENSIHGVIDTDLLEIVRDRLASFQTSKFSNTENEMALMHIKAALLWLNQRVEDRISRNVLGTNKK